MGEEEGDEEEIGADEVEGVEGDNRKEPTRAARMKREREHEERGAMAMRVAEGEEGIGKM